MVKSTTPTCVELSDTLILTHGLHKFLPEISSESKVIVAQSPKQCHFHDVFLPKRGNQEENLSFLETFKMGHSSILGSNQRLPYDTEHHSKDFGTVAALKWRFQILPENMAPDLAGKWHSFGL